MADDQFIVRLELDARQPEQMFQALSRGAAQAQQAMNRAGTATNQYARELGNIERASARSVSAVSSLNQSLGNTQKTFNRWSNGRFQSEADAAAVALGRQANAASVADAALSHNARQLANLGVQSRSTTTAIQDQINAYTGVTRATTGITAANSAFNQSLQKTSRESDVAGRNADVLNSHLASTRYALYDVSSTLGAAGIAMTAFSVATFAAGINWEKNFAGVIRTSGVFRDGPQAIDEMRQRFIELQQVLPVASSELAEIGTLAGQLGIQASGVDEFTDVVSRLSAVTDLSAESAGTALGRFNALFDDINPSNFENLASAILKVGVNSVATETQIVNVATQISSMGSFAGLTADQVVGLSGALASVGAQPELSRGTITRVFTLMSKAIASSGEELDEFARVAGVSSEEFAASWGTPAFGEIFQKFLQGISREGDSAIATLNGLGITSVRDVPLLLRLAQAGDTVTNAFDDAASGFADNTELADQYSQIAGTMAAKLQILANNFEALLVALSDGGNVFGGLVDGAIDLLQVFTDLANTPVLGDFLQLGVVLTGLVGVFLLVSSLMTRMMGSALALRLAARDLGIDMSVAGARTQIMATTLNTFGISAGKATLAARVLGTALKAASLIGLALVLPDIAKWSQDVIGDLIGVDKSFGGIVKRFKEGTFFTVAWENDFLRGAAVFTQGIGSMYTGTQEFVDINEKLKSSLESGQYEQTATYLKALSDELDLPVEEVAQKFPGLSEALNDAGLRIRYLSDGGVEFVDTAGNVAGAATEMASAEQLAAEKADVLSAALGVIPDQLAEMKDGFQSGMEAFGGLSGAISQLQDEQRNAAEATAESTSSSKDSWQDYYDGVSVSIDGIIQKLTSQNESMKNFSTNLATIASTGATEFATQLAKMGPEGAAIAQEAVNRIASGEGIGDLEQLLRENAYYASEGWADEFTASLPLLMDAYNKGGIAAVQELQNAMISKSPGAISAVVAKFNLDASKLPINFQTNVDTTNATNQVNHFITSQNGRRIAVYVDTYGGNSYQNVGPDGGPVSPRYRASGGYISGPGTATSDSIPAYLSNGEYVIRAASVRAFGIGFFNALNQGKMPQGFANGGPVRQSPVSVNVPSVFELGPRSLGRMGGGGNIVVTLDDVAIARASNRGNQKLRGRGV